MIKMNSRNMIIVLAFLVALSAGTYVFLKKNMESTDLITDDTDISPGDLREKSPGGQSEFDDSLGLRDITLRLISGLNEIVDNKGTAEDIINLAEELEIVMNSTLASVELDERQIDMVDQINAQLGLVRSLLKAVHLLLRSLKR